MKQEKPAHIPKEILVGYQYRDGTVNGKLAFATAKSITNKLYSENQFYGWCNSAIEMNHFKNELMNGFFLNKSRGRYSSYGSDALRVFHPLGFEFEIDVANISYILQHSNINMSEISSRCVLGWINGKLILIPEKSPLYEQSNSMASDELKKVGSKIFIGKKYITKDAQKCIYLGEHDYYFNTSQKLTKKERVAIYQEYEQEFKTFNNTSNINNNPYWFVFKGPLKQHLCYDIEKHKFFNVLKSALKLEIPEDPISKNEVNSLLEEFEKTDNGNRTISKTESYPEHILKWIKITHSEFFTGYYDSYRHNLLGLLEDNETGVFIHYDFKNQIDIATRNKNEYINKNRDFNGLPLRESLNLPKLSSYSEQNLINYLIWFKLCEKRYVNDPRVEEFDYSAIKDVLKCFNIFSQGKYKKTENIEYFNFYERELDLKEIEIFDLDALNAFLDDCVEALKDKVTSMAEIRKETNIPIIMELYNKFFENEEKKMLVNIDKHLKVISYYKEKNDYYYILNGKE